MNYISKVILASGLLALSLATTSCNKSKDLQLQKVESVTLQLKGFTIKSSTDASLAGYFFSISNLSPQGVVANHQPLPYNTEIKDVTLEIATSNSAATVEVAIGTGSYEKWTSTTKYTIPDKTDVFVKLSLPNTEYSYTYKVQVNEYQYDPATIAWTQGGSFASSILSGATLPTVVPYGEQYLLVDGKPTTTSFYTLSKTNTTAVPPTFALSALSLSGIPSGDYIVHTAQQDGYIYASTKAGGLYQLSGTTWQSIAPAGTTVALLLGALPARSTGAEPTLALLIDETPSATTGKSYSFASYNSGTLTKSKAIVPSDFPVQGDHIATFGNTKRYVGSSLILVATTYTDDAQTTERSTWYTTNGLSWINQASQSMTGDTLAWASVVYVGGVYYRLETNSKGLDVYMSSDALTWTKSSEVALGGLTATGFAQRSIVAWTDTASNTICLLSGVGKVGGSGSAILWQGIPKRDDY